MKQTSPRRADQVGIFVVRIARARRRGRGVAGDRRAVQELARRDAHRDREGVPARLRRRCPRRSWSAIRVVSFVVIVIIMAVMANTMAMTARERLAEYATLKALGFGRGFVARADLRRVARASRWLGGALGVALHVPGRRRAFGAPDGHAFPVFEVRARSRCCDAARARRSSVGVVAAALPGACAQHACASSTACGSDRLSHGRSP